ncbi:MAG: hypothetical protein FWB93_03770 [Oscillospiraceae bacterium]|nr:hypothetical protein [Oscillospiraceae bacterium]
MLNKTYDKKKEKIFSLLALLFGGVAIVAILVIIIRPFTMEQYMGWEAINVITDAVFGRSSLWLFLIPVVLGIAGMVFANLARKNYNEDDVWAVKFMGKKYSRSARRGKVVSVVATSIAGGICALIFVAWGMMPSWPTWGTMPTWLFF